MKRRFVIVLIVLLFLLPEIIMAKTLNGWKNLDQISDDALQLVKSERYVYAKQMLEYFSNEFLELNVREHPFTMDELRIITISHENALQAVTSTNMKFEERVRQVTQFRLVVDAIYSEHEPLWSEMENSIMTTFNQMKSTIENGNSQEFHHQLNLFLSKYEMIHPSLKLDVSPEKMQKLDAHIHFLDNFKYESVNQKVRIQQITTMETDLKTLFDGVNDDEADPSLIWVMISTGSFILLTLSYVGWRKYNGDRERRQSKNEPND